MTRYAKAAVAVIAAVATALVAVLTDDTVTTSEWLQVAIAGTSAVVVWLAANVPDAPTAKTWAAATLAALQAVAAAITGGITGPEWIGIALSVAAVLGVWGTPNGPARGALSASDDRL